MRTSRLVVAFGLSMATPAVAEFIPGRLYIADPAIENCWGLYPNDRDLIWEVDPATGASRIFAQVVWPSCGVLSGLAFTPDGSRLRASNFLHSQILEFDGDGNYSVALDSRDGVVGPFGSNNLAYDPAGNFFVVTSWPNIMRFPAGGGPGSVFADPLDGIRAPSAVAAGPTGDLFYLQPGSVDGRVIRFTPGGEAHPFPDQHATLLAGAMTFDDLGDLYVWFGDGVHRYVDGDPGRREFVASSPTVYDNPSIVFSPVDGNIYLGGGGYFYSLDRATGTTELVAVVQMTDRFSAPGIGMTVFVPEPNSCLTMMFIAGALLRRRRWRHA